MDQSNLSPLSETFHRKDAAAFMCEICRQTFMVNARPPLLYQHVIAKHPAGTDPKVCFPVQMKDFDPLNPTADNAPPAADAAPKPKKVVKKNADLDSLLDAGLTGAKKIK